MRAMSNIEYFRFIEAYLNVARVDNEKARSALHFFFYCTKTLVDEGITDILKLLEEGYKTSIQEIEDDKDARTVFERYLEDNGLLVKPDCTKQL